MVSKNLKVIDLFSGIGGFSLGLGMAGGFETVRFCEKDKYCRKVLNKHWPDIPIAEDIHEFKSYKGEADIIVGGFPCQPFSTAGKRLAGSDSRHLWPEMLRVIKECRPTWVIGENVAGLVSLGLDEVLSGLASAGYSSRVFDIPAVALGAPHRRSRLWIVAHSDSDEYEGGAQAKRGKATEKLPVANTYSQGLEGLRAGAISTGTEEPMSAGCCEAVAHTTQERKRSRPNKQRKNKTRGLVLERPAQRSNAHNYGEARSTQWSTEPNVGRVVNGVPRRVDRLRALGNAVVPQIVAEIGLSHTLT